MVNYDSQGGFVVTSITENSLMGVEGGGQTNFPTKGGSRNKTLRSTIEPESETMMLRTTLSPLPITPSPLSTIQIQQQPHKSPYLPNSSMSVLTIKTVSFHHAGNYTCAPSNARPASITVHVLRGETFLINSQFTVKNILTIYIPCLGEKPAAMQHANRSILDGENNSNNSFGMNHIKGFNGTNSLLITIPSLLLSVLCLLVNLPSTFLLQKQTPLLFFVYVLFNINS